MLITTWNVNSLNVRLSHVLDYLDRHEPDILALQETKLPDEKFPRNEIEAAGYQVCYSGQKTYNGVAIISKQPCEHVISDVPDLDDPQRRLLATTIDDMRIINIYIPNGQEVGSEKYDYKFRWLSAVRNYLQSELNQHDRLIVLGDFNIAPADIDVHDPKRWHEKIMCSSKERTWFSSLLELGLIDTLRSFQPLQPLHTWWDYRLSAFDRNWGIRIDHLLATPNLTVTDVGVDTTYRALERPSDHAPTWIRIQP